MKPANDRGRPEPEAPEKAAPAEWKGAGRFSGGAMSRARTRRAAEFCAAAACLCFLATPSLRAGGSAPTPAPAAPAAAAPDPVAAPSQPVPPARSAAPAQAVAAAPARPPAETGGPPAAVPVQMQNPAEPPADAALEGDLEKEQGRLTTLEAELEALEIAPVPKASALPDKAPAETPAANPADVPKEPLKELEEDFANALYAMGKYDAAAAEYRKLRDSRPEPDVEAWARFQIANCARKSGDLATAATAYEDLLTACQTCAWAADAAWWANEVKWRTQWNRAAQ